MKHVELRVEQDAGVGQGYFIEEIPPGINALVLLKNEGKALLQLVITRYNAPTLTFDVAPHTDFAVELANIQTVGIFVPVDDNHRGKGKLIIIPNFLNINLV
ncbi:hypothetical protein D3C81_295360 [compost metagenome]|uniref:hypothetical protein n=1 Tax=Paenibacillus stellifer TaxID=169760 RepID=UPI00068B1A33|nr:hypothetical protein [Paenibacillus stellifer]